MSSGTGGEARGMTGPGMADLATMMQQAAPVLSKPADEVIQLHGRATLARLPSGEVELQMIIGDPSSYYRIYAYRMTAAMASEMGAALLRAAVGDTDD